MLKIPYGESDFTKVIREGYFYQDRTAFIRELENAPAFIFYLRPRRFGKSLFVSMLYHYYALEYQKLFEPLFGGLAIGKNPTPMANQYMVLSFEFTGIQTNTPANTEAGFLTSVRYSVGLFLSQYDDIFPTDIHAEITGYDQASLVMKALFFHYTQISQERELPKIYLLMDEYDHFTNELISFNFEFFAKSVTQNGFVRKFYRSEERRVGKECW